VKYKNEENKRQRISPTGLSRSAILIHFRCILVGTRKKEREMTGIKINIDVFILKQRP